MCTLTSREQADALCTVITLGYIVSAKDKSPKNSYIIFQEGDALKDKATEDQHRKLLAKLARLAAPEDLFEFTMQRATDKSKHPIILAHTRYSALQPDIAQDDLSIFGQLEKKINDDTKISLKGAYVGGSITTSKTELLDPSILYWYDQGCREISQKDAGDLINSGNNALAVTEAVQGFLGETFKGSKPLEHNGMLVYQAPERPLSAAVSGRAHGLALISKSSEPPLSSDMSDRPTAGKLFASVHGMTQAIIHYSRTNDAKERVNMELALGKDTCKVASCIPCSIFMWANETPASATHFGRGDNWNFPHDVFEKIRKYAKTGDLMSLPIFARNWVACVQNAYDVGKKYFPTGQNSWISEDLRSVLGFGSAKVPQLFLEALTFESSFLDKMLSTLKNMPMK